jgi:hypothetical protein
VQLDFVDKHNSRLVERIWRLRIRNGETAGDVANHGNRKFLAVRELKERQLCQFADADLSSVSLGGLRRTLRFEYSGRKSVMAVRTASSCVSRKSLSLSLNSFS